MKFLDASIQNHQTFDLEKTIECYVWPGSDFLLFGSARFDILLATNKYDLKLSAYRYPIPGDVGYYQRPLVQPREEQMTLGMFLGRTWLVKIGVLLRKSLDFHYDAVRIN